MNSKSFYIINWDKYWKQYATFNPDLRLNGITSKRALMNHYKSHGYNENRKLEHQTTEHQTTEHNINTNENMDVIENIIIESKNNQFILDENMFKEKI